MGLYAEYIFPWIMERSDSDDLKAERSVAVTEAAGEVLEIGVGIGANFEHYIFFRNGCFFEEEAHQVQVY